MVKKLRIGIIGCGGIAHHKHFPSLRTLKDFCEMVAFCDIIEERATSSAESYGSGKAKVYINYLDLLNDDSIDVVHVLTPNVTHKRITVDALDAGKHVLCEKPMAHTAKDAQEMLSASKRTKKKFTIGYQNRYREDVQALYSACSKGALGDIYFAKAHAVRRRAVPTWGVFQDKSQQGGGPLIDIGTHALDLTLWMMNNYKPKSVTGAVFNKMADKCEGNLFGPWDPKKVEVEDSAFGFIKMDNGALIFLETSWILNTTDTKEASVTLCGTEAGAAIKSDFTGKDELTFNRAKYGQLFEERMSDKATIALFEGTKQDPGQLETVNWLLSIINDKDPLVLPEQAFVVTQILDAIYTSHNTGKMIVF